MAEQANDQAPYPTLDDPETKKALEEMSLEDREIVLQSYDPTWLDGQED